MYMLCYGPINSGRNNTCYDIANANAFYGYCQRKILEFMQPGRTIVLIDIQSDKNHELTPATI